MSTNNVLLPIWPDTGQILGVSRATAFQLANADGFPIVRIGKRKLVPADALYRWIEENTIVDSRSK